MSLTRAFLVLSLALVGLSATVPVNVNGADYYYSARQYYGGWYKHPTYTYYYRKYYYKPSYEYVGYHHHYCTYYPSRPKYYYFYNPYKKQYWGRCPVEYGEHGGQYSMLPDEFRKPLLKDIPEEAFPKPSAPPTIPEATDKVSLDLPPDDLPEGVKPTITAPTGE